MPQMAPLSWLLLFFMFIIIFILFNIINYYVFLYPVSYKTKKPTTKKINWKW